MADSNQSSVNNLLASVEFDDPRLYDALALLIKDVYKAYYAQFPPVGATTFGVTGQVSTVAQVNNFTAVLLSNDLRLTWDGISGITQYEIRYTAGVASDWNAAAQILRTSSNTADIDPVSLPLVYGNHTFFIKAINNTGAYSSSAAIITVNIPQIPAPVLSATVIDNNVLLSWTIPDTTFDFGPFNVYKDGVQIGIMQGTFEAIFETVAGTYIYGVELVDIVGNISTRGVLTVTVNQPPDFELHDNRFSTLGGTKTNVVLADDGLALLCSVDTSRTWAQHFTDNAWTKIQDQIDAGFPIYLQPAVLTGSYEEVIDYGTVIDNTILSLRWGISNLAGSVSVISKIAFSLDNITYTAFTTADSAFSASMRYAKIRMEFTGADTTSLARFSSLNILLSVKREMDSGSISALSTDVTGTAVAFNKSFKSIDSITLTVSGTTMLTAVYASLTTTGFKVYVFNSSGVRASATVSWKARGVV